MKRPLVPLAAAAVAVLALTTTTAGAADTAKVTRSTDAPAGAFPGQVAVFPDNGLCGGTLISPDWVLTAAHCISGGESPDVLVGTVRLDSGGTLIPGSAVFVHPDFAFPANDIALVRLSSPAPGPFATLAYEGMEQLERPGNSAVVTGFGRLSQGGQTSDVLQQGDVPVISDEECDAQVALYGDDLPDFAYPTMVCAGAGSAEAPDDEEADACQGDSGGPLWSTGFDGVLRQIGLVSGGPTCGFSPSYYTSVEAHMGYIESITGLQFASFGDIPGNPHEANIERIVLAAITGGFGDGTYRPSDGVSRGQLATFVARAAGLAPAADGPFSDVEGTPHEASINAVAAAGIVGGFSDGTFRPSEPVTRAQMATFIARAVGLDGVEDGPFSDTAASAHRTDINAVAAAGIAGGFADGTYRPDDGVSRAQMASFLAKAFLAD